MASQHERRAKEISPEKNMLTISCVLRSGGGYDQDWVAKLQYGVARNLTIPHRFICFSDVPVPVERIPLKHNWPGWWSKIEVFSFTDFNGPHIYLDLDTIVCANIDLLAELKMDFGMCRNFNNPEMVNSSVMLFNKVPTKVYEKFAKQPDAYIHHYNRIANETYVGDQAFIWDALGRKVDLLTDSFRGICSYKRHCTRRLPPDTSIVCFHGHPKCHEVDDEWVKTAWQLQPTPP